MKLTPQLRCCQSPHYRAARQIRDNIDIFAIVNTRLSAEVNYPARQLHSINLFPAYRGHLPNLLRSFLSRSDRTVWACATRPSSPKLGPRRVDALEGDAEVKREIGLHVVVGLVAARRRDGIGFQVHQIALRVLVDVRVSRAREGDGRAGKLDQRCGGRSCPLEAVCWHLRPEQRHGAASAGLP